MSTSDWIAISGITTGLFITIVGSLWHLSFKIGGLTEKVTSMDRSLEKLTDTTSDMRVELGEMQVKLDVLWRPHVSRSNSPIVLNEVGLEILAKSNIGSFADRYYAEILKKIRALKPENAYQAQELLISIVARYRKVDDCKSKLQEIAFTSGYDINSLLFVGALSIRDKVIFDLGFGSQQVSAQLIPPHA